MKIFVTKRKNQVGRVLAKQWVFGKLCRDKDGGMFHRGSSK